MSVLCQSCDNSIPPSPSTVDDLERNNGVDRPYFMTKSLQRLMGVSNKVKPGEVQLDDLETQDGGEKPT